MGCVTVPPQRCVTSIFRQLVVVLLSQCNIRHVVLLLSQFNISHVIRPGRFFVGWLGKSIATGRTLRGVPFQVYSIFWSWKAFVSFYPWKLDLHTILFAKSSHWLSRYFQRLLCSAFGSRGTRNASIRSKYQCLVKLPTKRDAQHCAGHAGAYIFASWSGVFVPPQNWLISLLPWLETLARNPNLIVIFLKWVSVFTFYLNFAALSTPGLPIRVCG